MLQCVDPWPIILNQLWKFEKWRPSTSSNVSCISRNVQFQFTQFVMTDIMANFFMNGHTFKAKLTLILDGNWFLIASTVSVYSLWWTLFSVLADGSTNLLHNPLSEHCSLRCDFALHGPWAETNRNMRRWLQVSWWNLVIWKSFAASLDHFVWPLS